MENDYDDRLTLPPPERLREIAARQEERAKAIQEKRALQLSEQLTADKEDAGQKNAAEVIQKNFRGYRERRAMRGYGLDPSTRWMEALKDANYAAKTAPKSRKERENTSPTKHRARDRWRHANSIAQRAGSDNTSESELEGDDEEAKKRRQKRREGKAEREGYAKVMGLEYFLEMVDQKHRYGSNLRRYHHEWKKADTHENFFFWLDYGSGKDLDLEDRPRKRLDTEQVRYLSREERRRYLVTIDAEGRFCWAKDAKPITTSPEFKDSINGIVAADDSTPTWREVTTGVKPEPSFPSSSSSASISGISTGSHVDTTKYANEELHDATGLKKLNHLSVDTVTNHLLRKTTKKNTWIFVADTSFRLYIGIKQSGAFQHSSFLNGARVSAAGLIKCKRGQLRKLSPLSGHYAPTTQLFRGFVKSLKAAGTDMSHCNISRSYAVLLGLEGYLTTKKRVGGLEQGFKDMLRPGEKRRREEEAMDKSKSAEKEREVLGKEREVLSKGTSFSVRVRKGLGMAGN